MFPLSEGESPELTPSQSLLYLFPTWYELHVREDYGSCTRSCGWVSRLLCVFLYVKLESYAELMCSLELKVCSHWPSHETCIRNWMKEGEGWGG